MSSPTTGELVRLPVVTIEGRDYPTYRNDRGEEVMQDLDIAAILEMPKPHNIRSTIERHSDDLGEVFHQEGKTSDAGGRPGTAYYLTEAQALFIAAKIRTRAAAAQLKRLIAVYLAARAGNGSAAVAMAHGSAARLPEPSTSSDRLMVALLDELAAGREERRANLAIMSRYADRLDAVARPVPVAAQPKALPAPRKTATVEQFVAANKLAAHIGIPAASFHRWISHRNDLRTLQRADGKWPLAATMEAWRLRADRVREEESRMQAANDPAVLRAGIVNWIESYSKTMRLSREEANDIWRQVYGHFQVQVGYDPRELVTGTKRALDVVQERGDLAQLDRSAMAVCPPSRDLFSRLGHA